MTTELDGSRPVWLGRLGHVSGLTWSFSCPGGCDQASATLAVPASYKSPAIEAGRLVRIYRGASCVWNGQMLEPEPAASGWALTAVGSGNFGTNFVADYTTWNNNPDESVNRAITRGLAWTNPGIGSPAGMWLGQRVDPASQTITDLLNLVCTRGGLVWEVSRQNVLSVVPLPTAVTRLLVSNTPVARTLAGDLNTVWFRFQEQISRSFPGVKPVLRYFTNSVASQASIDAHGALEAFLDLSSAGVMPLEVAQGVASFVLQKYQGASFAGPFTVTPQQFLTTGGTPADLGCQKAGIVCQLICVDYGYGGELNAAPVTFLIGEFEYDDDAEVATITPFQAVRSDLTSLLSVAATQYGKGVGDWQRR